ncbi:hypothetical protein N792_11480 [Lysobacter concretionis Ko07 = DSM 16239]|jgi:hypothetical protein|uniref:Uncharacterized protein n=1 Tax=Lysobacter concretionis Ko07 = DSM 16239 TaxID=1122185 RepID=A0A0A0EQD6_9GAMM|nr:MULTISPECIES: hypothetical protein [Lysobacter]KGM51352.1 hypothetical protein N792_11480 [Lysobacter concretionis Ko07 = DSM 16239]QOD91058.1 hypothetical protein H2514_13015 [Lysobacter sp. CW239]
MNAHTTTRHFASRALSAADLAIAIDTARSIRAVAPVRRAIQRERDFGVGYGNSSGYAGNDRYQRTPSYVNNTATSLFRFA